MKGRELLMSDTLAGEHLAEANRVLRWHGIKEMEQPCQVQDLMQHLTPMEISRLCHIWNEIMAAIEEIDRYSEVSSE